MRQSQRILLVLGAAIAVFAAARHIAAQTQALSRSEEYCLVSGSAKENGRIRPLIDFGEGDKAPQVASADEYVPAFGTVVGVLNHMSAQGWEFAAVVPTPAGNKFLMRRRH